MELVARVLGLRRGNETDGSRSEGVAGVCRKGEKHDSQGIEKPIEIKMTTNHDDLYCLPALSRSIKIDTRERFQRKSTEP